MAYQFAHVECYARQGSKQGKGPRKWSISDVAAEAMRTPDACPHVEHPKPPTVLHGCAPDEAARQAEKWGDDSRDAKGRRLRKDGLCMLAGVVSLPVDRVADWPAYRAASVAWLQTKYGDRLRSVVEHTDEAHPHLHFYAIPLPGERFESLHAGRLAASQAAERGETKGKQNEAYKQAMRGWQDDFAAQVAAPFGLTRIGPSRRRLTRAQWQAEKQQAQSLALPLQGIQITPEDVKKRAVKSGWLGSEYESSEALAERLTKLAQEQAKPLAFRAKLGEQRGESEARTEAARDAARAAEAAAKAAQKEAEKARAEAEIAKKEAAQVAAQIKTRQAELSRIDRDIDALRSIRDHESGLTR